jgi:hypothetical protein
MIGKLDNSKPTFRFKHIGVIALTAVILLGLNWFKTGFLVDEKSSEISALDILAGDQAYNEWSALMNQDGEQVALALPDRNENKVVAVPEVQNSTGQVLGESEEVIVLPKFVSTVAAPLLTGRFTAGQIQDVNSGMVNVFLRLTQDTD